MLTDIDINVVNDENWTLEMGAKALAFVINNNVVHTLAAKLDFYNLLLNFSVDPDTEGRTVIDLTNVVVEQNSEESGLYILNFIKNNETIETISTSEEILQAVLLSDPLVVVLQPEIKILGVEPGWKYIDQRFSRS
jgi:hypothetical protein